MSKTLPAVKSRSVKRASENVAGVAACNMVETNGGGLIESVPGFNVSKALTAGFNCGRVPPQLRTQAIYDAGDFQFAAPQSVCGADDRVEVSNTSNIPWRCVCQLVIEGLHGVKILGTGWLAGPRTIFTAGHNLFDPAKGQQASRIWITPGRRGDLAPYGYTHSTVFDVHPIWRSSQDPNHDVGVIYLQEDLGNTVGWFGFTSLTDSQLTTLLINNAGYPVDKPFGTMWFNASRILQVRPDNLVYGLDTEGGQSGSPIFFFDSNKNRIVVAIHAYGTCPNNIGVRINPSIYAQLASWVR